MNARARLIATVRYAGMRFTVEGDRLVVTGNTARLTPGMRHGIATHKPGIIATLNRLPAGCVVPHLCGDLGSCCPDHCEQAHPQQEGRKAA